MSSKLRSTYQEIIYRLLAAVVGVFSRIPLRIFYVISDITYYPLYHIFRYRRKIVRKNLLHTFPEKPLTEIIAIERKFYRFFTDMIFEALKLYTIKPEEIKRRAVFKNVDTVVDMLRSGRSVSVYIGHYGNWEWITSIGLHIAGESFVPAQIYRKLNNQYIGRLVKDIRNRFHNESVDMHHTAKYIAGQTQAGKRLFVGFLTDQSPKRRESKYFLDFFNRRIPVLTGVEKITKHFDHQAVFLSARRIRRGYYEYEFTPLCNNPKSLPDYELTSLYFRRLEEKIKECPELYLWTHNRFKYEAEKQD